MTNEQIGTVYLVGAGPGDEELITVRGLRVLREADAIVYDRLIGDELLQHAKPDAEKIYVGKEAGRHAMTQDEINEVIVAQAKLGRDVCRLKGGDPFVFGRGGEEALFCLQHGVPFEIVPGVTSSIAAPAYAGIPVTHRGVATSFAVVTGHTKDDDAPPPDLPRADTLVFLMGVRALGEIVRRLIERGDAPSTPVALVRWGTTEKQQVVTGTLQTIEAEVEKAALKPPALIVVGEVVKLREQLRWFDDLSTRPLWGKTVVVTRSREQASSLVKGLKKRGARVLQCPTIRVASPDDSSVLDESLSTLASFDWIVFTSVNGVEKFWEKLREKGMDARALSSAKIAAIGPATVSALENRGLFPDFVPESSISESVAEGLIAQGVKGARVLMVRARQTREVIDEKLSEAGANVTAAVCYQTLPDNGNADEVREKLAHGEVDWITFTSSSTVRNFLDAVGAEAVLSNRRSFRVACIGPITAQTARENGLEPDAVAPSADVDALLQTLLESEKK